MRRKGSGSGTPVAASRNVRAKGKAPGDAADRSERAVMAALGDLFASIAKIGVTEDPLALACKTLMRCVGDIRFAFYCHAGEETGHFAAIREGVKILIPPPDVERKIVASIRRMVRKDAVAVIEPEQALSLISPSQRRRWKCHRGMAVRVSDGASPEAAILSVYFPADFTVTARHRAWLSLFGEAASTLLSRQRLFRQMADERAAAVKERQGLTLTLEALRKRVYEHLAEVGEARRECQEGTLSFRDAMRSVGRSAETLYSFSDVMDRGKPGAVPKFRDPALGSWVREGMKDPQVKAIVGLRGSNKSAILHAIHGWVLANGVSESNVAIIDFEDARFRRFKAADDVVAYLGAFPKTRNPHYLFLDGVGTAVWHAELLRHLRTVAGWNVWVASSTAGVLRSGKGDGRGVRIYRVWADPNVPRPRAALERVWCQVFMRDVASGIDHQDIRAKEALAEYYSDHLGEILSVSDVSKGLLAQGCKVSRSSVSAYRQSLVDAYLIEVSEVYDTFERRVVTSVSGPVFYTDLELRTWRYGCAPEHDIMRMNLNRFYLRLRRKYGKVYTPRDKSADFVTIEQNGRLMFWKMPPDSLATTPLDSRSGGGLSEE